MTGKLSTVIVPDEFAPLFAQAEEKVGEYFRGMIMDPTKGIIEIDGERYVLARAESLSHGFIEQMCDVLGEETALNFLYSFAKTIGKNDAKRFHEKLSLEDPIEKLSAGPVHFSHTGWAMVDILPTSAPSPDENYFLEYNHPNTFEADSYIKLEKKTSSPICVFSAGYSAGWCSESFGLNLDAKEITCRAMGHEKCHFIMAPPEKLVEYVKDRTE